MPLIHVQFRLVTVLGVYICIINYFCMEHFQNRDAILRVYCFSGNQLRYFSYNFLTTRSVLCRIFNHSSYLQTFSMHKIRLLSYSTWCERKCLLEALFIDVVFIKSQFYGQTYITHRGALLNQNNLPCEQALQE